MWFISHYIFNLEYAKPTKDIALFFQKFCFWSCQPVKENSYIPDSHQWHRYFLYLSLCLLHDFWVHPFAIYSCSFCTLELILLRSSLADLLSFLIVSRSVTLYLLLLFRIFYQSMSGILQQSQKLNSYCVLSHYHEKVCSMPLVGLMSSCACSSSQGPFLMCTVCMVSIKPLYIKGWIS